VVATLALSIIVDRQSRRSTSGGWNGLYVDRMTLTLGPLFELSLFDDMPMYYTVLAVVVPVYAAVAALMRARFSEIVVGIRENGTHAGARLNVPAYKTLAFASGLLAGLRVPCIRLTPVSLTVNAGVLFSTQAVIWVAIGGRHSARLRQRHHRPRSPTIFPAR
jgi:ABC-type branched-subunit amino acid transport system permease subunit